MGMVIFDRSQAAAPTWQVIMVKRHFHRSDGFKDYSGIRSTCRQDLADGVTGELVWPVMAMLKVLIER